MQILNGLHDMKRKIYLMIQLGFLISPRKIKSMDMAKIMPTINIFKSVTLKGWHLIRYVC
jgi:hypothetical protein